MYIHTYICIPLNNSDAVRGHRSKDGVLLRPRRDDNQREHDGWNGEAEVHPQNLVSLEPHQQQNRRGAQENELRKERKAQRRGQGGASHVQRRNYYRWDVCSSTCPFQENRIDRRRWMTNDDLARDASTRRVSNGTRFRQSMKPPPTSSQPCPPPWLQRASSLLPRTTRLHGKCLFRGLGYYFVEGCVSCDFLVFSDQNVPGVEVTR